MSAFSRVPRARKPPRVIHLPPSAFADTSSDKPLEPVAVGIKLISEGDTEGADVAARQRAERMHPERGPDDPIWDRAYNEALMVYAVAVGHCHPDSIHEPLWDMAFDTVPRILTTAGIERLFDEIELIKLADSPLRPEASDDELATLSKVLATGTVWQTMSPARRGALRRMLRFVLDEVERS